MAPPAPPTFSMITGTPSRFDNSTPSARPVRSVAPPGWWASTIVMALLGYAWALGGPDAAQARPQRATARLEEKAWGRRIVASGCSNPEDSAGGFVRRGAVLARTRANTACVNAAPSLATRLRPAA